MGPNKPKLLMITLLSHWLHSTHCGLGRFDSVIALEGVRVFLWVESVLCCTVNCQDSFDMHCWNYAMPAVPNMSALFPFEGVQSLLEEQALPTVLSSCPVKMFFNSNVSDELNVWLDQPSVRFCIVCNAHFQTFLHSLQCTLSKSEKMKTQDLQWLCSQWTNIGGSSEEHRPRKLMWGL